MIYPEPDIAIMLNHQLACEPPADTNIAKVINDITENIPALLRDEIRIIDR
jgi:uncharacterized protein YbaR (Trm112 family)